MKFKVEILELAFEQIQALDKQSRGIIKDKIRLIKQNPYRFKPIHGYKLKLFRVRFSIHKRETRLVYAVIEPNVVILCLLERGKEYRDLGKHVEAYLHRKKLGEN